MWHFFTPWILPISEVTCIGSVLNLWRKKHTDAYTFIFCKSIKKHKIELKMRTVRLISTKFINPWGYCLADHCLLEVTGKVLLSKIWISILTKLLHFWLFFFICFYYLCLVHSHPLTNVTTSMMKYALQFLGKN